MKPAASAAVAEGQDPVDVAPDSPRAAVRDFLELTRKRRDADAALYMEAPYSTAPTAPTTARHLQTVLERELAIDLDTISPESVGKTKDDLPAGVDEIGILTSGGTHDPVRLVTRTVRGTRRWVFSRSTIDRTEARYAQLRSSWLEERLPPFWLGAGPWGLRWWQWVALPALALVAVMIGRLLATLSRGVLGRVVAHTTNDFDDELVDRSTAPLALGWGVLLGFLALPWLDLRAAAGETVGRILKTLLAMAFLWGLMRSLDVVKGALLRAPRAAAHPSAVGLIDIGTRLAKLLVAAIGVTIVLSQLGYSVTGMVAGLGIGGLAVALAFQKTGENLFGSIALGVDQPFRVGDYVSVDGIAGTVEVIGLRSTRLRTLDRTLVTIPNGKLADMKIESYAARDRIRLFAVLSLDYRTTPAQMRQVLAGVEAVLRAHPKIWPDVIIRFTALANSSLDIEVMAWFQTQTFSEFQTYRQEVLLDFMDVVREAGTSFAFPTQTVHLAGEPDLPLVVQGLDGFTRPRRPHDGPGG
ncbi:MAG: mechanosensitive ion channel family protein [Myxococcales bacterium]|nr:MAG: mechanosensitive ion channel family protein [Myxococcales bacterium]